MKTQGANHPVSPLAHIPKPLYVILSEAKDIPPTCEDPSRRFFALRAQNDKEQEGSCEDWRFLLPTARVPYGSLAPQNDRRGLSGSE